jgi:hypothetical protein
VWLGEELTHDRSLPSFRRVDLRTAQRHLGAPVREVPIGHDPVVVERHVRRLDHGEGDVGPVTDRTDSPMARSGDPASGVAPGDAVRPPSATSTEVLLPRSTNPTASRPARESESAQEVQPTRSAATPVDAVSLGLVPQPVEEQPAVHPHGRAGHVLGGWALRSRLGSPASIRGSRGPLWGCTVPPSGPRGGRGRRRRPAGRSRTRIGLGGRPDQSAEPGRSVIWSHLTWARYSTD